MPRVKTSKVKGSKLDHSDPYDRTWNKVTEGLSTYIPITDPDSPYYDQDYYYYWGLPAREHHVLISRGYALVRPDTMINTVGRGELLATDFFTETVGPKVSTVENTLRLGELQLYRLPIETYHKRLKAKTKETLDMYNPQTEEVEMERLAQQLGTGITMYS